MPIQVSISDDSIKLGQFIKLASLVDSGGQAKEAILGGEVTVNGETETRRGRTLRDGDVVCRGGACAQVVTDAVEEFFDEATADDDFDPEKWRNL
ncbi:MAG TPA: RNA-binding S4 domain-containing protein [Corynebacterium sp.]|nr:RNA-binding S4 domain-containing protein [Corynebacterium sp.]